MKRQLVLMIFVCCAYGEDARLTKILAEGKTDLLEYSIMRIRSNQKGVDLDLVLGLRNVGAKSISVNEKDPPKITITGKSGNSIPFRLQNQLTSLPFNRMMVLHIVVEGSSSADYPWVLKYDSENSFVPVHLVIPGIEGGA
jgi:hypothetical protein